MTISNTLAVYGFAARRDGSLFWGVGSLVWGHTATVKALGSDLYGGQALAWIFTELKTRYFWGR